MNKTYLLLLVLLLPFTSFGQPIVTNATNSPVPGDFFHEYVISNFGGFHAGDSGTNVFWDFSNADGALNDSVSFVSMTGLPHAGLYPTATVACNLGGFHEYYEASPTAFTWLGDEANTCLRASKQNIYPLQYLSDYKDTQIIVLNPGDTAFYYFDVHVDGYGYMRLPTAYHYNVLRKRVHWIVRQHYLSCGTDYSYPTTFYQWEKQGMHYQLLRIYADTSAGTTIIGGGYYYVDKTHTTSVKTVAADNTITLYPNPARSSFTIKTTEERISSVTVYDVTGKCIVVAQEQIGSKEIYCNCNCGPGIYIVHITTDSGVYIRKVSFL